MKMIHKERTFTRGSKLAMAIPPTQKDDVIVHRIFTSNRGRIWARWYTQIKPGVLIKRSRGKDTKAIIHGPAGEIACITFIVRGVKL